MSQPNRDKDRSRYTKPVLRAIDGAEQLAWAYNHEYLASEHLLGGLLNADPAAAAVLHAISADPARIREALVNRLIPSAAIATGSKVPRTPCLARALEGAAAEADALGNAEIDVRHVLIGLALCGGLAAELLRQQGVEADALRGRVGSRPMSRTRGARAPGGNGAGPSPG
jgi:ATP-dependent Clp protease ATP-binding subunit ClpA